MSGITRDSSLLEVAALVSESLHKAGITATLSGGSAVSIYSENRYQSEDLDFVTTAMIAELTPVLVSLGFSHTGTRRLAQYTHPDIEWYVEFPPAPLAFGHLQVNPDHCTEIQTDVGKLRIISPTQSVMDRLAAALAWKDVQSRQQAILVASHNDIDWKALKEWFRQEGEAPEAFARFEQAVMARRER